jgi:hypothetical protein
MIVHRIPSLRFALFYAAADPLTIANPRRSRARAVSDRRPAV